MDGGLKKEGWIFETVTGLTRAWRRKTKMNLFCLFFSLTPFNDVVLTSWIWKCLDRLYGLVISVLGYRSGGPGSIPATTRKRKVVGLERGPLSLVSTTEELLDRRIAAPVYETENTATGIHHADHVGPFIRKKLAITSPTSGGRSVGIVRSRLRPWSLV
jgi:hypothetical protein